MTDRPGDAAIAIQLRAMCAARARKTICPSEVARALAENWRPLMADIRRVAAMSPDIVATQRGRPVDPLTAKGPIRLALREPPLAP
ncbi:MAG: DUF3253 domain-containing protein [Pseudomonadota bacterium]